MRSSFWRDMSGGAGRSTRSRKCPGCAEFCAPATAGSRRGASARAPHAFPGKLVSLRVNSAKEDPENDGCDSIPRRCGHHVHVSLIVVAYLRRPLKAILADLCGTAERARFWSAFSNVTLVLVPLIFVMQYRPE